MKRRLLFGAAVFLVFAGIFSASLMFSTKRTLPANAVCVRFVGAEAGRIAVTNTTGKRLLVQILALQIKRSNEWTDVPLTVVPETIPPRETVSKRINPAPSGEPWRLKMLAAEEITGADRLVRATIFYAQNHLNRLRRRSAKFPFKTNAFATTTVYWGQD